MDKYFSAAFCTLKNKICKHFYCRKMELKVFDEKEKIQLKAASCLLNSLVHASVTPPDMFTEPFPVNLFASEQR